MEFFKKIKERKKEAQSQAVQKELTAVIEKRLKYMTMPETEEPKPSSPGASAREYYEFSLNAKDKSELFFVALWLIAEFYSRNKGMGAEYVQKAVTVYQQLIKAYFTSGFVKKKKADILTEYYHADEAQLKICVLFCVDLKQPDKALPYYGNFGNSFPNSKHVTYCQEHFAIIKENLADSDALLMYLAGDLEHGYQRYTQARSLFEGVVNNYPKTKLAVYSTMRLGDILYFQEKDIDAARKIYEEVIEKWGVNEQTSRALYQIGDCFRETAEWDKAIEYYGQYVMDGDTKFRIDFAKYYMAICHENLGHWDEAEAAYQGVIDMEKSYWKDKSDKRVKEIANARERGTLEMLAETLRVRKK